VKADLKKKVYRMVDEIVEIEMTEEEFIAKYKGIPQEIKDIRAHRLDEAAEMKSLREWRNENREEYKRITGGEKERKKSVRIEKMRQKIAEYEKEHKGKK